MSKSRLLFLVLFSFSIMLADQNGDIQVQLESVINKRNERLNDTHKQNLELSSGEVKRNGFLEKLQILKDRIGDKADINITLQETKDYFLQVPGDNGKFLRLRYALVQGEKGKNLYVFLTRFMLSSPDKPQEIFIDLKKLAEQKNKEIQSIQLTVIVDGPKMEDSRVEAIPVFKNESVRATCVRPS